MSEFELVTIALSFIVGFGVTGVLSGLVSLLTHRDDVHWDWVPLVWAAIIFADLVMFWFGALWVDERIAMTLALFWWLILLASLMFLSGSLILPSQDHRIAHGLRGDFDLFGRRALVPLGIFEAGAAVTNYIAGDSWLDPSVYLNVILAGLAFVAFRVSHRTVRGAATLLFAGILTYGIVFVWARPGAVT